MAGLILGEKYKLLKDTPVCKAGDIFIVKERTHNYYLQLENDLEVEVSVAYIHNFDEWFERVNDRGKPKQGQEYFFINSRFVVIKTIYYEDPIDKERRQRGNLFPSKAEAELCLREFIKPALEDYHAKYDGAVG